MKKAAIYARVSSQKQKEDETIESQELILQEFGLKEGYQIPETWLFLDNGVSGQTLQRPALDELRDLIRTEPVDMILIYAPDRLARNYPHQLILLDEFRRHGVKVHFIRNGPQGDTPEAIMFTHFQGIFAEYERALILDRSRRGTIHKAKMGDPAILPKLPYGYRKTKNDRQTVIEIVEENANIVRKIFNLYVHERLSLNGICRRLSEDQIKSPKGNSCWFPGSVSGILKNRAYTGSAAYGKSEKSEGIDKIRHYGGVRQVKPKNPRKKTNEESWYDINVPIIISESDFETAQEYINKNKELALRNTKEPSLLQGLITCGECGCQFYKRLRKYKGNKTNHYYCRSQSDNKLARCSNVHVDQEELDNLVYHEIIQMLQNPFILREELKRREKESGNVQEIERQEISMRKELEKLTKERERLLDAYQSGLLDLTSLSQRAQGLEKRRSELENEQKERLNIKLMKEIGSGWEQAFEAILERINKSTSDLPFIEKQKLVRLIVEKIIITKGEVKIMHCISPKMIHENCQLSIDGARYAR
jgi:site-specific DNA recombinase